MKAKSKHQRAHQKKLLSTFIKSLQSPTELNLLPGYDSLSGEFRKAAVKYDSKQEQGLLSTFALYVCTSTSDLCSKLEINQSLSASFGPYGGDEKLAFFKGLHTTSTSTTLLVYVRHLLKKYDFNQSVELADGISPPHSNKQIINFFKTHGDCFISSISIGGEYYAGFVFDTQTTDEQNELVGSLKGQGMYSGVTFSGSLQEKLSNVAHTTNTSYNLHQSFSGIKNLSLPNADNLIDFALKFPSLELDNPTSVDLSFTGYEHIDDFEAFDPVVKNRKYFIGNPPAGGLTSDLLNLYELKNKVVWIQDIHKFYKYSDDKELHGLRAEIDADINTVLKQIDLFTENPTLVFTKPPLTSLQKSSPKLNYFIGYSPKIGGDTGDPADFGDAALLIKLKSSISRIETFGQKYLDSITTSFVSPIAPNEEKSWNEKIGGNGGHSQQIFTFNPEEYITHMSGKRSDGYCGYIKLCTTEGRTIEGGGNPGSMSESFTEWDVPGGSFVVRFVGREGSITDRFQVVYAYLKPTVYG